MLSASDPGTTKSRVRLHIQFLTSLSYRAAHSRYAIHLYQMQEQSSGSPPTVAFPSRRLVAIADSLTARLETDMAIQRCVALSRLSCVTIGVEHLVRLNGPLVALDILLQQCSMIDFVRTVGALYEPLGSGVPLFVLEEHIPLPTPDSSTDDGRNSPHVAPMSREHWILPGGEGAMTLPSSAVAELQQSHLRELQRIRMEHIKDKDQLFAQLMELESKNSLLRCSLSEREAFLAQLLANQSGHPAPGSVPNDSHTLQGGPERNHNNANLVRFPIRSVEPSLVPSYAHASSTGQGWSSRHPSDSSVLPPMYRGSFQDLTPPTVHAVGVRSPTTYYNRT